MKYVIIFLSFVALYIISSVELGYLPLFFASNKADEWNSFFLNLSYSYLASVIFYIIIEFLPRKINERKAFKVFEKRLKKIFSHVDKIIGVIMMICKIDDLDKLYHDSFSSLSECGPELRCSYIDYTYGNHSEKGVIDCYAYLEYHSKSFKKEIEGILGLPFSSMLSQDLIATLIELKHSEFINYSFIHDDKIMHTDKYFVMYNSDEYAYNFFQLFKSFKSFFTNEKTTRFTFLEIEQIEKLKPILSLIANKIWMDKLNMSRAKELHFNSSFLCLYALPEKYKLSGIECDS